MIRNERPSLFCQEVLLHDDRLNSFCFIYETRISPEEICHVEPSLDIVDNNFKLPGYYLFGCWDTFCLSAL